MFKILKQELLFIPLLMVFIELLRSVIFNFYPNTAFFDRGSELETFVFRAWQMVWITCTTWLLIRVIFPSAFRSLKKFYSEFENFTDEFKQGFSLKLFLVVFFGLVFLLSGKANNNEDYVRKKLVDTLESQLYVREATGHNDGVEVERYLNFAHRQKGDAWCAAYVSSNYFAVGIKAPISAWAPVFANTKYVIWSQALIKAHKEIKPKPGDCFTIYFPSQKRVGHTGFIVGESDNYFITNEGNTALSGTREGSGVHKLKRAKSKIYTIANYITPNFKTHEKTTYTFSVVYNILNELQSQNDSVFGKDNRYFTRQYFKKANRYLPRFIVEDQGVESTNTSTCKGGFKWGNQHEADCNRYATITSNRFNCKRYPTSRLYLQGFRTESKTAQAYNRNLREAKKNSYKRKAFNSNEGSSVYSEMG